MERSKQDKLEARQRQEEQDFKKILVWFGACVAYGVLVFLLNRFLFEYDQYSLPQVEFAILLYDIIMAACFVVPVLTAVCAVWFSVCRQKGKDSRLPQVLTLAFAALTFTCLVIRVYWKEGLGALNAVAPVVAVLAAVYYIYQKEFFCNTALTGAGAVVLWVYRKAYWNHPSTVYAGVALVAFLLVIGVVLARMLERGNGKLGKHQIFPGKPEVALTYVSAALTAVALVLALALGATVAYYAFFMLIAWLFCMAVYYTVRLM